MKKVRKTTARWSLEPKSYISLIHVGLRVSSTLGGNGVCPVCTRRSLQSVANAARRRVDEMSFVSHAALVHARGVSRQNRGYFRIAFTISPISFALPAKRFSVSNTTRGSVGGMPRAS